MKIPTAIAQGVEFTLTQPKLIKPDPGKRHTLCGAILILVLTIAGALPRTVEADSAPTGTRALLGQIPLNFEPNVGQEDDAVKFLSRGPSYSMFMTQDELVFGFLSHGSHPSASQAPSRISSMIHMKFVGANPDSEIKGGRELPGRVNYFLGNDARRWKTDISTFREVNYSDIYSGIDLVFYGTGQKLEYDFVVKPGADPTEIRFALDGVDSVRIQDGALLLSTAGGSIAFKAPLIYQSSDHGKREIAGSYSLEHSHAQDDTKTTVSFKLGPYDRNKPLIIDPILDYSTYLGGISGDWASGVAVDAAGEAYVVGTTSSPDFPTTPGSVQPSLSGCSAGYCRDVFITKFNASGTALVYSTYLGGSNDDYGAAIAVDASGNAYLTGATQSMDFPTTAGAVQRSCGGTCFYNDAFVAKLNATGSVLAYSTYLGGSNEDDGTGISVLHGNTYVSGFSGSTDFPVTPGAFQTQMQGQGSSFVVELNANGTALNYGTFIGEVDLFGAGPGIAVDSAGNSYLAGVTLSANFPFTSSAFHTVIFSGLISNTYITKLNPTGSALFYSALLGGASINRITIDSAGAAYFAGPAGTFYPISPGALDPPCGNGTLVAKLSPDGSVLDSAALVCSESFDQASIARDQVGNIFIFGDTDSTAMPTTVGAFQTSINNGCCFYAAFLAKLTPDFSALGYSTYFGGSSGSSAGGAATDSAGNVYGVGSTSSTDFPIRNAFQATPGGGGDAFVSKFSVPKNAVSIYPAALNFNQYGLGVSSAPLTVTVANISNLPLNITNIISSGDFSQTNTCGAKVVAGGQCTVKVVFTPQKVGTRNGSLTLKDNRGKQTVALIGTGVNGAVFASSSNYEIDNQPIGYTSPPLKIVVSNLGNKDLKITSISLQNGPTWNFFGNTNCLNPVKPHGSCSVQVDFTPDYSCYNGDYSGLQFVDNADNSPQGFGLLGRCGPSTLAFSTYGARFDQIRVGHKSGSKSVSLINGLSSTLTISKIVASSNFIQSNNCPTTLNPGAYCYLKVTFTPTQSGILQGNVMVTDSSNNSYVLPLLGTGAAR
jgi:hypothetical protein